MKCLRSSWPTSPWAVHLHQLLTWRTLINKYPACYVLLQSLFLNELHLRQWLCLKAALINWSMSQSKEWKGWRIMFYEEWLKGEQKMGKKSLCNAVMKCIGSNLSSNTHWLWGQGKFPHLSMPQFSMGLMIILLSVVVKFKWININKALWRTPAT